MSAVNQILATVDLLSIIPIDSELKQVGQDRWRGKCPIGNHSQGGFSVTRHRDGHLIFQCFSCGKRGSVIDLFAELNGLTTSEAIRAMVKKETKFSNDIIFQRSYDSYLRNLPGYAWLICDSCGAMKKINSSLEFAILCNLGSWLWDVCSDGSARCIRCRRVN